MKSVKADFYPRVSLTGGFQYHILDIESLLESESTLLGFGPSLYLPLFNRKMLKEKYKIAGVDLNIFIEEYNDNLIKAYQDINNDLSSLKVSDLNYQLQKENLQNSKKVLDDNEILYEVGNISNYQFLLSKLNYLDEKLKVLEKEYDTYSQQVNLITSLGGDYKENVK